MCQPRVSQCIHKCIYMREVGFLHMTNCKHDRLLASFIKKGNPTQHILNEQKSWPSSHQADRENFFPEQIV